MTGINGRRPVSAPDHDVLIVGAGLSGIGVAHDLLEAGITDFVILESSDDVGGTWRDNTYPGVGVDVPTFAYQFSYFLKPDWSRAFAKGHEVKQYVDDFVEHFGIRPHIRFGVKVTTRMWDDEEHLWRVATAEHGEITARFVVNAVGAYIERRPVTIPGFEGFTGKVLEPTSWDHDYDLTGKRVAVVGTGATAVQIIPSIAEQVEQLDVYQRTAIWTLPKIDPEIPAWLQSVFARSPKPSLASYHIANGLAEMTLVRTIMRYTQMRWLQWTFERIARLTIRAAVRDRQLRRKLTPTYPFGAKRPAMSNDYLQAFNRSNVELVTDQIDRFTPTGIRTITGDERPVDAVVVATGFRMAYDPAAYREDTRVSGRAGFDLGTRFAQERLKAYEGLTMPGLPNYFMAFCGYSAVGGSWHLLVENMARHVVRVIQEAHRRGATCAEITQEAADRHHAMITERIKPVLMYHRDCSSANTYYLDHHGDASVMRPTSIAEARRASQTFPLGDYRYSTVDDSTSRPTEAAAAAG